MAKAAKAVKTKPVTPEQSPTAPDTCPNCGSIKIMPIDVKKCIYCLDCEQYIPYKSELIT